VNALEGSTHVLIVDDDADLRQVLSAILAAEGYGVGAAAGGTEALRALVNEPFPTLILLDLRMPGMSGEELKAKLDRNPKWAAIPIVVLSGDADAAHVAHTMGVRRVSPTPVALPTLLKGIAEAVAGSDASGSKTAA
jgi:two-component system, chemotaxis family, chemotaxis protein CheY